MHVNKWVVGSRNCIYGEKSRNDRVVWLSHNGREQPIDVFNTIALQIQIPVDLNV